MTVFEAKEKLTALQRKMAAYEHAQSLLYYDGCTSAPKGSACTRANSLSILSEESYKLYTGEETVQLLEFLDAHKDELNEKEQRIVYLLLKDIREMAKIPMDEYVAYQELLVKADDVWHTAKETSDFALFEPYLQQIFDTNRKFAGYIAPEKDPYDHYLNEYEEGLSREVCDRFFDTLKARLVPLIRKVGEMPQVDTSCIKGHFIAQDQEKLAHWVMRVMCLDPAHIALSTTEHPFTTSLGSHEDVRITTHYYEENVSYSMFSVIHEGGHALYDSGSAEDMAFTALDGGISMGIHESQSRFYENILGRSKAFCGYVLPAMKALFPQMLDVTEDEFFKAINVVEPSLIRTEADEVTYCLHVLIRYEIEKRVMAGELAVHDIPAEWNRLYKEYLGIDVPDDKHGCLQDSHWSGGLIGYFPSYAIGSAYGAQFLQKMKQDLDVDALMAKGDFAPVNAWLKDKIWQYGRLYTPAQILDNVLGEPFDPNYYLDYLEEKCKAVYGF